MSIKGILIALPVAAITWFISAIILDEVFWMGGLSLVLALVPAAFVSWIAYSASVKPTDKTTMDLFVGASTSVRDTVETIKHRSQKEEDYKAYATAEEEIEKGTYDKGLWAKALVNVDGNKEKRPTEYMKLRVSQIQRQSINNQNER